MAWRRCRMLLQTVAHLSLEQSGRKFSQSLSLGLEGDSYHPRFVHYVGLAELRLLQDVRQDRSRAEIERSFARRYQVDNRLVGAKAFYKRGGFRLDSQLDHQSRTRTGAGLTLTETVDQVGAVGRYLNGRRTQAEARYQLTLLERAAEREDSAGIVVSAQAADLRVQQAVLRHIGASRADRAVAPFVTGAGRGGERAAGAAWVQLGPSARA